MPPEEKVEDNKKGKKDAKSTFFFGFFSFFLNKFYFL